MNKEKNLKHRIRGWLPEESNSNLMRTVGQKGLHRKRKFAIITGGLTVVIVGAFFLVIYIGFMVNPIVPADVKIFNTLSENKDALLNIDGVVGAGIARNSSDNHILGIAVYVEDNSTAVQEIPSRLGEFSVFIKSISGISESEKEQMIISREDMQ